MSRLPTEGKHKLPVLVCLLFFCFATLASETSRGEIQFAPARKGPVWVGQKVELNLELWSTGYRFGDQLFALPEVSGGYLMQADSSTVKLSESRGGVQWQGLSYALLFYPQRAGRLEVPSFAVQFSSATAYGSEPTLFHYRTPTLYIDVRLPPGANPGALLVTTDSFRMDASWMPRVADDGPVELKVGDALTLTIQRVAQDVPGMVFAPLPDFKIEGVSVYPDAPGVNDHVDRGSLTGSRTDSVTYIFEREGLFAIPGLEFQWWDPVEEVLSEETIAETPVIISANPAFTNQPETGAGGQSGRGLEWQAIAGILGLLAGLAYLLRLALPYLQAVRREKAKNWLHKKFRSMVCWVIRDVNELPPLNPLPPKVG